ncbi:hypothetical protein O6P43_027997 [Quillaja saponaria]|uniref:Uncharacterized protein n=1 Tax=Quillaja saponaria TaxID=32244 RepID=A0AAD7L5P2_QUISA|nr:hypothetical protein O6P43_027997 [Quillaja saponaria]
MSQSKRRERAKTELSRQLLASKGRLKIEFNELSSSDCEILEGFATEQFMSSTGGDYEVTKSWQSIMHELFQIKSDLKFKEMKMKTKAKRGHGNTNLENKFHFQIPARPTYNMNMNNNIHRTQLPSVPSFTFNASMEASANIGTRFDNSGEQKLNGLINHNGHVSGTANGSIFVLYNCNFHARTGSN